MRLLGLSDELYQLLQACCVGKKPDDFVFARVRFSFKDRNRRMRPVGDFRKLWRSIVTKAGIERDVLFHDFSPLGGDEHGAGGR